MRRFLMIALGVVALDQATKVWVDMVIPLYGRVEVIPGFFELTNVRNPGAAWGMLRDYPQFLTGLAVLAMAALILFRKQLIADHRFYDPVLAILLGGVCGNLIDRIRLGEVIDFLWFDLGFMVWPTFNVADSAICVSVTLSVLISLLVGGRATAERRSRLMDQGGAGGGDSEAGQGPTNLESASS